MLISIEFAELNIIALENVVQSEIHVGKLSFNLYLLQDFRHIPSCNKCEPS